MIGDCICLFCKGTGIENQFGWICTDCGGFGFVSEQEQIEQKEYFEKLDLYYEENGFE